MDEKEIIRWIKEDKWMMDILLAARTLNLPDWWICAGFVRSKIWDTLHQFDASTPLSDIDVIYYDPENLEEQEEKVFEEKLRTLIPEIPWSVKNEARMHIYNNMDPYLSSVDAISKFPETVTALGVKIDETEDLILTAPCGITDVVNMEVRPTAYFKEDNQRVKIYRDRVIYKDWKSTWHKLKIFY